MSSKRLVAVHLLNDWSGSPLVFRQALEALQQSGYSVELFTATASTGGFLSDFPSANTHPLGYRWSPSKLVTLLNFLGVQVRLFVRLLFFLRPGDQLYINTLLPFGAALAGKVRRCPVTYHVHEVSIRPRLLRDGLRWVADRTAQRALFVSEYTRQQTALRRPSAQLVYNTLPDRFWVEATRISTPNMVTPFTALMLCSNKAYKGINELVACARQLPHIRFLLVLNTDPNGVADFVAQTHPPANCTVYPAQTDTIPFYRQAHVVLNLSHPDAWVETFGMTILEAMACGRPVITPTVGGICELIDDGREGFKIDVNRMPALVKSLGQLSSDIQLYLQMAEAARKRARFFGPARFRQSMAAAFGLSDTHLIHRLENVVQNRE
ncbi:glycosyltransferase [Rudanella paleaurantiibacter]|uniref:Glycosyltransferase n=1 Tax=Rudanella paleaurantiibacter TaxID=2614655 RepID=A0A7J5TUI0_9BACT|nr:glycosyltransferase family 4 protein [Rudanella paleaurantiibacter]KAB7727665.1 glycosyltransferase [Rudanella paleaurantiibacter]